MEDGVGFEPTQTFVPTEVAAPPLKPLEYPPYVYGAPSRTRTGTGLSPRDFKSLVSTYFTTGAFWFTRKDLNLRPHDYQSCYLPLIYR